MKLYTLVGLPGSGKSTYAKQHPECVTISTDSIRKELYGDENIQGDGYKVFSFAFDRVKKELDAGNDVIFDATNITKKYRKKILDINADHIAIFFTTSVTECLRRNLNRDRVVPEEVILNMYQRLSEPSTEEGFKEIIKIY